MWASNVWTMIRNNFIVTCVLFETISFRIGWWGTSCQSSADKLQSAPFFWRQRFLKLFKRVSQIVFSTGRVRSPFTPCLKFSSTDGSLWWVRKLKTCPTLTRGSAKICRDRYQRKKEKVGTTYFLSWKIGLGSQWESYLDWRGGGVTKWITAGKCPFIFRSQWDLSQ